MTRNEPRISGMRVAHRGGHAGVACCDPETRKAMSTTDTATLPDRAPVACSALGPGGEPTYIVQGREVLTSVFADLKRCGATTQADHAAGEHYATAHEVFSEDDAREMMVASLRCLDTFAKLDRR
jgi:hypothetical protein